MTKSETQMRHPYTDSQPTQWLIANFPTFKDLQDQFTSWGWFDRDVLEK